MYFGRSIGSVSCLLITLLLSTSCERSSLQSDAVVATEESNNEEGYSIVCTIGMIADVVRVIAADTATVEAIIGEGVDPHLYKPTRDALLKLSAADVVFYNGLLLEGKITDLLAAASDKKPVQAVTELIGENSSYLLVDGDNDSHYDPHVWMDVQGWMQIIPVICDTLCEFAPQHAEKYAKNASAYQRQLEALDNYAKNVLSTIPAKQRVLVTAHDAFNYLGRAYGISVRGIQGISTESEAGLRDLENLVDFIVEKQIPAVFVESSVADKNVRALVEGAQARGHPVVIGGKLYSDAMGAPGTYPGTYIGMVDHNITTIASALGGSAKGFKENSPYEL